MYNFFDKFISWSSKSGYLYKFLSIVFAPIFYFIYWRECVTFWNIITNEIGDKKDIIDFLDKNEFGVGKFKLYKGDVIYEDSELSIYGNEQLKQVITQEYSEMLLSLFKKNCSIDIENYISLIVQIDIERNENTNQIFKIYHVIITYYRIGLFDKSVLMFKWWLAFVAVITTALYLTFRLY